MVIRNEASALAACLDDIKNEVNEIIIVDQSSDDPSVEICRRYTNQIFIRPQAGFCEPDRQFSIDQARQPWILILDADERLDDLLKSNLKRLTASDFDVYGFDRKEYIDGLRYAAGSSDVQIRFFKKAALTWPPFLYAAPQLHTTKIGTVTGGYLLHLRSFERIQKVYAQRNTLADPDLRKKHETFIKEVRAWLKNQASSGSKVAQIKSNLRTLDPNDRFELKAILSHWQAGNPCLDHEEALIRLLFEISKE
jgi:glycosyltransferase involved in cell wall biosynthesis